MVLVILFSEKLYTLQVTNVSRLFRALSQDDHRVVMLFQCLRRMVSSVIFRTSIWRFVESALFALDTGEKRI